MAIAVTRRRCRKFILGAADACAVTFPGSVAPNRHTGTRTHAGPSSVDQTLPLFAGCTVSRGICPVAGHSGSPRVVFGYRNNRASYALDGDRARNSRTECGEVTKGRHPMCDGTPLRCDSGCWSATAGGNRSNAHLILFENARTTAVLRLFQRKVIRRPLIRRRGQLTWKSPR